jgi:molybdate transport system ATP-binding protein
MMGLNLYPGVLTDPPTGRVDLDGGRGVLFAAGHEAEVRLARDAPVLVALAPSAIALHTAEPGAGSPRNVWAGVVTGVELLTDRVRIAVTGRPDSVVDVTPAAVAELGLVAGQPVWLTAKATEAVAYPNTPRAPS